jgi:hypothetical protein
MVLDVLFRFLDCEGGKGKAKSTGSYEDKFINDWCRIQACTG